MTNMKRTLLHSMPAFHALMQWYPLKEAVVPFLGEELTTLFAHSISAETDCLICETYLRRDLIEAGKNPDELVVDELERNVIEFGRCLTRDKARVRADLYEKLRGVYSEEQMVALTAFGAMMLATNVFNNALEVDLDDYLEPYRSSRSARSPEAAR
jgi:alkylhydroperoxidase family enzyme